METDLIITEEHISDKIYLIRGVKVMLDRDLAVMYDLEARRLREQVKRNADRFPSHFMFQLNEGETYLLVSQNMIPSMKHLGGSLPFVFSEYGVQRKEFVLSQ